MTSVALALVTPAAEPLTPLVLADPKIVLLDPAKFDRFYEEMRQETDAIEIDLTTEKGRDVIRAMAFKVARTKTAIDAARKDLTEDWRKQTAAVNATGSSILDRLEALQKEVRKPLTDWEEAEKARVELCKAVEAKLDGFAVIAIDDTSEKLTARLDEALALVIATDAFQERTEGAQDLLARTVATLQAGVARLQREEADRAELQRHRDAEAQRAAEEAARFETERQAELARHAERERQAEIQRAADTAAEATRRELEDETELRLKAANNRAEAAERLRQEEIDKAANLARQRQDNEAEAARRAADAEHKAPIMRAAKEALMEHAGLSETAAKRVVLAITGGHVPNTVMNF